VNPEEFFARIDEKVQTRAGLTGVNPPADFFADEAERAAWYAAGGDAAALAAAAGVAQGEQSGDGGVGAEGRRAVSKDGSESSYRGPPVAADWPMNIDEASAMLFGDASAPPVSSASRASGAAERVRGEAGFSPSARRRRLSSGSICGPR
jgi:hypothetical protein